MESDREEKERDKMSERERERESRYACEIHCNTWSPLD